MSIFECVSICVSVTCVWVYVGGYMYMWVRKIMRMISPTQPGWMALSWLPFDTVEQSWPNQVKAFSLFLLNFYSLGQLLHWNSRKASQNVVVDYSVCSGCRKPAACWRFTAGRKALAWLPLRQTDFASLRNPEGAGSPSPTFYLI